MPNPTNVDETLTLEEIASLPAIITTDVAARVMGVSPKTIRRACEEGAFRCFRAPGGRYWRIVTSSFLRAYGLEKDVETLRLLMPAPAPGQWVGRVHMPDAVNHVATVVDDGGPKGDAREARRGPRATFEEIRDMPRALLVSDVARIGGKSEKTIRRYLNSGALRGTKVGSSWVVDKRVACDFFGITSPALIG